jgi:NTE family protein
VLFEPVRSQGRLLVDGSLAAPTPVRAALRLGADLVIAVNVAWAPDEAILDNPADMLFQTMQVMAHNLNREELARADLVIAPDIRRLGTITTDSREALVEVGREAARVAIPAIQEAVRAWRIQRGLLTVTRN